MEYQAQSCPSAAQAQGEGQTREPRSWRFTDIYEALLSSEDLIEPELVELGRLVAKRLAACRQRRRAAMTVHTTSLPGYGALHFDP